MNGIWQRFDRAEILLPLTMLFWAGNITVGRAMRGEIPPITLAFWRWTIALMLVLIIAWPSIRRDWPVIRAGWKPLVFLGATGIGLYNTLFYVGLSHTQAMNGMVLQGTMPILVIAAGALLFGDRIGRRVIAGLVLSFAGVLIVAFEGNMARLAAFSLGRGEAWMLGALSIYSLYAACLRRRPAISALSFIAMTFAVGILMLLPAYLWERSAVGGVTLDARTLSAFAYVGVAPSLLAYLCFNRGVALVGSSGASVYFNLIPVFGAALAAGFLGESIGMHHVVGAVLISCGIFLGARRPAQRA